MGATILYPNFINNHFLYISKHGNENENKNEEA